MRIKDIRPVTASEHDAFEMAAEVRRALNKAYAQIVKLSETEATAESMLRVCELADAYTRFVEALSEGYVVLRREAYFIQQIEYAVRKSLIPIVARCESAEPGLKKGAE